MIFSVIFFKLNNGILRSNFEMRKCLIPHKIT